MEKLMRKLKVSWNPFIVVSLLGIFSTYYFGLTGTFWAVTGEFTRWGGHIMQFIGMDTSHYSYLKMIHFEGTPLERIDGIMIIGMFLGAIIAALLSNNVKFRIPTSKVRVFQALLGGIMAGFGARLAMGCNLAAFFTGIPQFSLHAWFFTIFTIIGTYIGTKIIKLSFFSTKIKMERKTSNKLFDLNKQDNTKKNRIGIFLCMLVIISLLMYVYNKQHDFPLVMVFGLTFGFLLEKGQVCFTSAFRDLWIAGRTNMLFAIVLGLMISTIGTYIFIKTGLPPKTFWAGPNAMIGGFVFGVGIVIAGGCETGWMYRAVEGQVHYILVGIGNIIGSILLVLSWDSLAPKIALSFPKVSLISYFGDYGGLILTYSLLLISMLLIMFYEKRYFKERR
ncbi:selenium metabolism membrane protein YedE/FdhT [Listeria monocytogenes]|nr:selenium metabolism membrane protein YedE/FdhT [Listeria monocytogenes]